SGDIAGADLGLEGVLLAGQVHLETIAAKYRAGSINGDRDGRGHPVVLGEDVQLFGVDRHLGLGAAVALGLDRAVEAQFIAFGADPAAPGPYFPGIAFATTRW